MTDEHTTIDFFAEEETPTEAWKSGAEDRKRIAEQRKRVRAGEQIPGMKKHPRPIYRRAEITEIDLTLMGYLALVRFASAAQIASLLNVKSARKRLLGLQEFGYVKATKEVPGKTLWMLTGKGLKEAKASFDIHDLEGTSSREPNLVNVAHSLAIGQVVQQLVRGIDALAWGKLAEITSSEIPEEIALTQIHSETFIERALQQALNAHQATEQEMSLRRYLSAAKSALESGLGWSRLLEEFPALWIVREGKRTHRPDFVIDFEKDRTSSKPVSIAVEVELSHKSKEELAGVFKAYAADKIVYAAVVYVVQSEAIAKRVAEAADRAGFKNLHFAALRGHDLEQLIGRAWKL